jgi:hypothetical protein
VTPASSNEFRIPAHLLADCSNDELSQVRRETLFWWQGAWKQASPVALTPATRVLHGYTNTLMNAKVAERPQPTRDRSGN